MAGGTRLSVRKKLLFSAAVFVPFLLVLEVLMRFCGYGPAVAPNDPTETHKLDAFEYFTVCDRRLGYRNRADGKFSSPYIDGRPRSTTDAFGYRNGTGWTAEGDRPIVLFIGDSTTFCSEVNDEQTGPSEVAKLLAAEFDVRVLNAGVRGYSTLQSKRMLQECLDRFPQVVVAVYTHCGNDLAESLVPDLRFPIKVPVAEWHANPEEIREIEVTEPAVPWGTSFLRWEPPGPPPGVVEGASRWLDTCSALWHRCRIGMRRLGGDVELTDAQWNAWARTHGGEEVLGGLLVEMDRLCQDRDVTFVTTSFYSGSEIGTPSDFAETATAEGIRHVSLIEHFTDPAQTYLARCVDGQTNAHYGPTGTKTYAAAMAPALCEILRSRLSGN
ncbi:MAG: SGNH/GDSL hydrolase family protein [Candidatus Nealsonbacteria bacterium]|nr:SGNH/GDSL hydrolase family protein [Candidatus Nealsonbacteria bacterium]